jgi:integrase/recombinase XerD
MGKNRRHGKAGILSNLDYKKLSDVIDVPAHSLIFSILRYTGERIGAVVQLEVLDCYENPIRAIPRDTILFKGHTRKQAGGQKAETHEVPISEALGLALSKYQPPKYGYLFPSPKNPGRHITTSSCDKWLRKACIKAGLDRKGISLHSFRRTLATSLHEQGVSTVTIQKITGHKSIKSLQHYIDVDDKTKRAAIELL